jgi:uncharacterized membrane protein YdjX (TVP38/TMEM64 family)
MKNKKRAATLRKLLSFLQLLLLGIIVIGIPLYILLVQPQWIEQVNSLEKAELYLKSYQSQSYVIYLGVQVLQIIISIIPGQFMNMAAGWLFGFPISFVLSTVGAIVGTFLTFHMAKLLGRKAVKTLVNPEKYDHFLKRLNSKRAYVTVFVLYLVPGLPKDILGYLAGVSDVKFIPFLVISIIGRLPALAVSIMVGSMLYKESYIGVVIISIIMVGIFIWGFVNRKKVLHYVDHGYEKYIEKKGEDTTHED